MPRRDGLAFSVQDVQSAVAQLVASFVDRPEDSIAGLPLDLDVSANAAST